MDHLAARRLTADFLERVQIKSLPEYQKRTATSVLQSATRADDATINKFLEGAGVRTHVTQSTKNGMKQTLESAL